LIDKLSFLKGGLDGGSVSADEERLMQLFQNRAGLKKAYADLKDEFHLLRDRLKQQEGATIRVQEQLDALGELLADPSTGFGALVFFQLRGLWKTCHQQLSAFATDLTRTQEVRESDSRGRHTTTGRQLVLLPGGGILIDTPGMRELQLWDTGEAVAGAFADVESIGEGCRFRDCRHAAEPGCAVIAAVASGMLPEARLESYRKLQGEQAFQATQQDERARLEVKRQGKIGAKALRKKIAEKDG
jgi:hypothetical protein